MDAWRNGGLATREFYTKHNLACIQVTPCPGASRCACKRQRRRWLICKVDSRAMHSAVTHPSASAGFEAVAEDQIEAVDGCPVEDNTGGWVEAGDVYCECLFNFRGCVRENELMNMCHTRDFETARCGGEKATVTSAEPGEEGFGLSAKPFYRCGDVAGLLEARASREALEYLGERSCVEGASGQQVEIMSIGSTMRNI